MTISKRGAATGPGVAWGAAPGTRRVRRGCWCPHGTPLPQRIKCMSGFDPETSCWPWLAATDTQGYGHLAMDGTYRHAHRASYMAFVGPIPEDMTVDHLCFNTVCVNPEHLRLLTNVENAANQRSTFAAHCKNGHEFTEETTRWAYSKRYSTMQRRCRECSRAASQRKRQRRKALALALEQAVA